MSSRTVAGSLVADFGSKTWGARFAALRVGLRSARRAVETRRELEELDAHVLTDIGVTRMEAEREARRSPWDLEPLRLRPNLALNFGGYEGAGIVARRTSAPISPKPGSGNALWRWQAGPKRGRSIWSPARGHWLASRQWVAEALRRRRSRQAIAELDEFLLKDVGVSRAEAEHEANKPFWR